MTIFQTCPACGGNGLDDQNPCATITTGPYGGVCQSGPCPVCDGDRHVPIPDHVAVLGSLLEQSAELIEAWCQLDFSTGERKTIDRLDAAIKASPPEALVAALRAAKGDQP